MPISPTTISDLKNLTAQLDFLLTASNIKIKNIPPNDRLCSICLSPFTNTVWKPSSDNTKPTINQPVQLPCGHIFGLSCLAHLIFTSDFHNRCPLCRAEIIPDSISKNPSSQSWKAAAPLFRLLMMFGSGDERKAFEKNMVLDVLLHGLEKEGLTGPSKGKHMHRIMVLYEEFLGRFCDEPPPVDDAERLADAMESVRGLRDLLRESQELRLRQEELRGSEARRVELAREEAEREVRDVREVLRGVREELRGTEKALKDAEEELGEARKKGRGVEKELEGVKGELFEIEEKVRKEWKVVESQLEEIERKLQYGFEEAEENGRKKGEAAMEEVKKGTVTLRAKAAQTWFLSLLALVLALVWVYC